METVKTNWVIDNTHSKVGFKVKHLMISNVLGSFRQFEGKATTDGTDFSTADIRFSLQSASVDTEMADRDAHLKGPDFFDTEKYPVISFAGKGLSDLGDDVYELKGNLTIKDVTKPVSLTAEYGGVMTDPWGNVKAGFSLSGKINRKDWGLNWNAALEAGGVLVGETVNLAIDVELSKVG
jgi:polyisoprenoid-binding protein YceI